MLNFITMSYLGLYGYCIISNKTNLGTFPFIKQFSQFTFIKFFLFNLLNPLDHEEINFLPIFF